MGRGGEGKKRTSVCDNIPNTAMRVGKILGYQTVDAIKLEPADQRLKKRITDACRSPAASPVAQPFGPFMNPPVLFTAEKLLRRTRAALMKSKSKEPLEAVGPPEQRRSRSIRGHNVQR